MMVPGVFLGLSDFTTALDSINSKHLETASVLKEISKTDQNELLCIMLDICKEIIRRDIKESDFVDDIAEEATDVSNYTQNIIVFRYIKMNSSGKTLNICYPTKRRCKQSIAENYFLLR